MQTTDATAINSDATRTIEVTINDQGCVFHRSVLVGTVGDMEAVGWSFTF